MSSIDEYGTAIDIEQHTLASDQVTATRMRSSFQQLPLEIRQQIYAYLGVPVAGKFRGPCCLGPKWGHAWGCPLRNEVPDGPVIISAKMMDINFNYADRPLQHVIRVIGYQWTDPFNITTQRFEEVTASLLRVSRMIRGEILSLFFNNVYVRFAFEVSDKPVGFSNIAGDYVLSPERMRLCAATFSFFAKVHLDSHIGKNYHPEPMSRMAEAIQKQASSTRYIAANCPLLRVLRVDPTIWQEPGNTNPLPNMRVREFLLENLGTALVEVVRSCECLETLQVGSSVWVVGTFPDGRVICTPGRLETKIMTLDLTNIAVCLKEDETRKWAAGICEEVDKRWFTPHTEVITTG